MIEVKHTPGPWVAVRNSAFWEINPANEAGAGNPHTVGDVCASDPGDADNGLQEANARLIAAAPDMLEALEELTTCVEAGCFCSEMEMASAVDNARAATAKAKGGGE